jgi:DNA mismatch repair protein PMS2
MQSLASFGFRGEALSSLCAVGEVSVVTCTAGQEVGVRLEYTHQGGLAQQTPCPRAVGTTVAVKDLFKGLPVRHRVSAGWCFWDRVVGGCGEGCGGQAVV